MKAEIGRLAALPPTADVVKQEPTCAPCGGVLTDERVAAGHVVRTIGQAFAELDHNGKRAWLAQHDVRSWSDQVGIWISVDGVTISPDQTSLGVDHWHLIDQEEAA
jgi:hypothetical protein